LTGAGRAAGRTDLFFVPASLDVVGQVAEAPAQDGEQPHHVRDDVRRRRELFPFWAAVREQEAQAARW